MLLSDYLAQADAIAHDVRTLLAALDPTTRLDDAKGQLNALKDARIAALQQALRSLAAEDRREAGARKGAKWRDASGNETRFRCDAPTIPRG